MMLITKEIANKLKAADLAFLESKDGETGDEIIVHFFNPAGAGDWWIVTGTPLNAEGEADYETDTPADWHLFGYCDLGLGPLCSELGYVLLSELKKIKGLFGLGIEREYHYSGSLKEVMKKAA